MSETAVMPPPPAGAKDMTLFLVGVAAVLLLWVCVIIWG